jgi:hypothetical protein
MDTPFPFYLNPMVYTGSKTNLAKMNRETGMPRTDDDFPDGSVAPVVPRGRSSHP